MGNSQNQKKKKKKRHFDFMYGNDKHTMLKQDCMVWQQWLLG